MRAVPEEVLILTIETLNQPHADPGAGPVWDHLGDRHDGFSHLTLRFGYLDSLDVPRALGYARQRGQLDVDFNPYDVTYFLSQVSIVPRERHGMPRWRKALFVAMARNASSPIRYFHLPPGRVVMLGAQVTI